MKHGTPWGYQVHRNNGEEPCEPCREALRERNRIAKERQRRREGANPKPRERDLGYDVGFGMVLGYCKRTGCNWRQPAFTVEEVIEAKIRHAIEEHDDHHLKKRINQRLRRERLKDSASA